MVSARESRADADAQMRAFGLSGAVYGVKRVSAARLA
jgi:hypothetical protein